MKDRYLFRGKRLDNGEWVYGGYGEIPPPPQAFGELPPSQTCIFCEHPNTLADWGMPRQMCLIDIDPATVGQCTGLHAAISYRGKSEQDMLIFEGDLISVYKDRIKGPVIFDKRGLYFGVPISKNETYGFTQNFLEGKDIKIIGNIHDETMTD